MDSIDQKSTSGLSRLSYFGLLTDIESALQARGVTISRCSSQASWRYVTQTFAFIFLGTFPPPDSIYFTTFKIDFELLMYVPVQVGFSGGFSAGYADSFENASIYNILCSINDSLC